MMLVATTITRSSERKEGGILKELALSLSERIVRYRAKHNLSQQEFADTCKLTKQTIGAIESGRHGITKLTRAKIMNVLESDKEE